MAAHGHALICLITHEGLHQSSMMIEVLDHIPLHDQREALLMQNVDLCIVLLRLVLGQGVIHTRWLNGDGQTPRQSPHYQGDATTKRMAREHHLTIHRYSTNMLEDLAILPLIIWHGHARQELVHGADDQSRGGAWPGADGGEDGLEDVQHHGFGPHTDVFEVIFDPIHECPRNHHNGDFLFTSPQKELHPRAASGVLPG
mmetsp:Transcript_31840/g.85055  ORF Transcript_31840/g.85055 Transcript_31840/m.85055 type:complete len:200 (-) Transcript_31840:2037-2636(-)